MRIAIFDYRVVPTNPIGGCHRRLLAELCDEHEFTVFAPRFDNPRPDRIRHVRVPVPMRPLPLLFVAYHLAAPLTQWLFRLRTGAAFEARQSVESNALLGQVIYAQFCHTAYLKRHTSRLQGLQGFSRWLDHWLHSLMENAVYGRARHVVVPSHGLRREISDYFPKVADKMTVVPNGIDVSAMAMPAGFGRSDFRRSIGLDDDDTVLGFVALGHFERKGLPLIMEALKALPHNPSLKLLVIGGQRELVAAYSRTAREMGLEGRVLFLGMRDDVKTCMWALDAFILPSEYEGLPLVVLEAAAAGLPIIVSDLFGVQDLAVDGENALLIQRTAEGVRAGIERFISMSADERAAMGAAANRTIVEGYSLSHFADAWRQFYRKLETDPPR